MAGVDLAREERLKKGDACIEQFRLILEDSTMKKIADKPSELGKTAKRLLTDIEFFTKSCAKPST